MVINRLEITFTILNNVLLLDLRTVRLWVFALTVARLGAVGGVLSLLRG